MTFLVHSPAARGRRWMKLKSNEFEPRWVITTKFHQINRKWVNGRGHRTELQTDRQTDTSTDNKGRLKLSGAREPTDILITILRSSPGGDVTKKESEMTIFWPITI